MNYLELDRRQLAWQFIQDSYSLVNAFEDWFAIFMDSTIGDDKFPISHLAWTLDEIAKAIQLARLHSPHINRFCEDIENGRAPSLKVGARLIDTLDGGTPLSDCEFKELNLWEFELEEYVQYFGEGLIIGSLLAEDGEHHPRSESTSTQQPNAVSADDLRARCREFVLVANEIICRLEKSTQDDWWNDRSLEGLAERLNFSREGLWLEILPNEFGDHYPAFSIMSATAGAIAPSANSSYCGSTLLERWFEGPRDEDIKVIVVSDPYCSAKSEWQIRASTQLQPYHMKDCREVCLRHLGSWVRAVGERLKELDSEKNTPEEAETDQPTTETRIARFGDEFRSVWWFGTEYSFTTSQANVVKVLWNAWKNKTPEVSHVTLLDASGSDAKRMRDVFRESGNAMNPAWDTMIQRGRKDTLKLVPPTLPEIPT